MLRALHAFMNACFTSSCLRGDHDEDAIPPAQLTAASEATSADTAARALPEDVGALTGLRVAGRADRLTSAGRRQAHNLLDLPDDILRLILLELHDGLLGVAEKECSRKAIPSHYLDVNKRLRSLAQPIWGRILRNPPASDPAKVFLRLLSFTYEADWICEADLVLATQEPVLYLALISQLRNLERLELDMEVSRTLDAGRCRTCLDGRGHSRGLESCAASTATPCELDALRSDFV